MASDDKIVTSREIILKSIRKALLQKGEALPAHLDMESDIYAPETGEAVEIFSGNFTANAGTFYYCFNRYDLIDNLLSLIEEKGWENIVTSSEPIKQLLGECGIEVDIAGDQLSSAEVAVTECDALIARTGTIAMSALGQKSRIIGVHPPAHIVIANGRQLYYDMSDYMQDLPFDERIRHTSMLTLISGPSRTADIEKTLVLGAHGPKEVFVFFMEEPL